LAEVIQPIRVALSGREVTPGIFEVIDILGKETVLERVRKAIFSIA
jgi:glutamyl-tRNA synthetase